MREHSGFDLTLGPALAADFSATPAAPPVPASPWSGSYFAIGGGGNWTSAVVPSGAPGLDHTPRFDLKGTTFGVTGGDQLQYGNWVIGYEGDAALTGKRGPPSTRRSIRVSVPR